MSWFHKRSVVPPPGSDAEMDLEELRERSERLNRDEERQIREARTSAARSMKSNEINGWDELMDEFVRSVATSGREN